MFLLFADDAVLGIKGRNLYELINKLKRLIHNLSIWLSINYLFPNTEKTVLMLFSPSKLQMPLPDIYFSGINSSGLIM